jgi:hypothetical protein
MEIVAGEETVYDPFVDLPIRVMVADEVRKSLGRTADERRSEVRGQRRGDSEGSGGRQAVS